MGICKASIGLIRSALFDLNSSKLLEAHIRCIEENLIKFFPNVDDITIMGGSRQQFATFLAEQQRPVYHSIFGFDGFAPITSLLGTSLLKCIGSAVASILALQDSDVFNLVTEVLEHNTSLVESLRKSIIEILRVYQKDLDKLNKLHDATQIVMPYDGSVIDLHLVGDTASKILCTCISVYYKKNLESFEDIDDFIDMIMLMTQESVSLDNVFGALVDDLSIDTCKFPSTDASGEVCSKATSDDEKLVDIEEYSERIRANALMTGVTSIIEDEAKPHIEVESDERRHLLERIDNMLDDAPQSKDKTELPSEVGIIIMKQFRREFIDKEMLPRLHALLSDLEGQEAIVMKCANWLVRCLEVSKEFYKGPQNLSLITSECVGEFSDTIVKAGGGLFQLKFNISAEPIEIAKKLNLATATLLFSIITKFSSNIVLSNPKNVSAIVGLCHRAFDVPMTAVKEEFQLLHKPSPDFDSMENFSGSNVIKALLLSALSESRLRLWVNDTSATTSTKRHKMEIVIQTANYFTRIFNTHVLKTPKTDNEADIKDLLQLTSEVGSFTAFFISYRVITDRRSDSVWWMAARGLKSVVTSLSVPNGSVYQIGYSVCLDAFQIFNADELTRNRRLFVLSIGVDLAIRNPRALPIIFDTLIKLRCIPPRSKDRKASDGFRDTMRSLDNCSDINIDDFIANSHQVKQVDAILEFMTICEDPDFRSEVMEYMFTAETMLRNMKGVLAVLVCSHDEKFVFTGETWRKCFFIWNVAFKVLSVMVIPPARRLHIVNICTKFMMVDLNSCIDTMTVDECKRFATEGFTAIGSAVSCLKSVACSNAKKLMVPGLIEKFTNINSNMSILINKITKNEPLKLFAGAKTTDGTLKTELAQFRMNKASRKMKESVDQSNWSMMVSSIKLMHEITALISNLDVTNLDFLRGLQWIESNILGWIVNSAITTTSLGRSISRNIISLYIHVLSNGNLIESNKRSVKPAFVYVASRILCSDSLVCQFIQLSFKVGFGNLDCPVSRALFESILCLFQKVNERGIIFNELSSFAEQVNRFHTGLFFAQPASLEKHLCSKVDGISMIECIIHFMRSNIYRASTLMYALPLVLDLMYLNNANSNRSLQTNKLGYRLHENPDCLRLLVECLATYISGPGKIDHQVDPASAQDINDTAHPRNIARAEPQDLISKHIYSFDSLFANGNIYITSTNTYECGKVWSNIRVPSYAMVSFTAFDGMIMESCNKTQQRSGSGSSTSCDSNNTLISYILRAPDYFAPKPESQFCGAVSEQASSCSQVINKFQKKHANNKLLNDWYISTHFLRERIIDYWRIINVLGEEHTPSSVAKQSFKCPGLLLYEPALMNPIYMQSSWEKQLTKNNCSDIVSLTRILTLTVMIAALMRAPFANRSVSFIPLAIEQVMGLRYSGTGLHRPQYLFSETTMVEALLLLRRLSLDIENASSDEMITAWQTGCPRLLHALLLRTTTSQVLSTLATYATVPFRERIQITSPFKQHGFTDIYRPFAPYFGNPKVQIAQAYEYILIITKKVRALHPTASKYLFSLAAAEYAIENVIMDAMLPDDLGLELAQKSAHFQAKNIRRRDDCVTGMLHSAQHNMYERMGRLAAYFAEPGLGPDVENLLNWVNNDNTTDTQSTGSVIPIKYSQIPYAEKVCNRWRAENDSTTRYAAMEPKERLCALYIASKNVLIAHCFVKLIGTRDPNLYLQQRTERVHGFNANFKELFYSYVMTSNENLPQMSLHRGDTFKNFTLFNLASTHLLILFRWAFEIHGSLNYPQHESPITRSDITWITNLLNSIHSAISSVKSRSPRLENDATFCRELCMRVGDLCLMIDKLITEKVLFESYGYKESA